MATIADMVVAASVDPSGMRRGFDQGVALAKNFGNALSAEEKRRAALNPTPKFGLRVAEEKQKELAVVKQFNADVATESAGAYERERAAAAARHASELAALRTRADEMKASLVGSAVRTKEEAAQLSETITFRAQQQELDASARHATELAELAARHGIEAAAALGGPAATHAADVAGRKVGDAFDHGVETTPPPHAPPIVPPSVPGSPNVPGSPASTSGGPRPLQIGGRNANALAVQASFAFEQLAQSAGSADGAVRTVARSVASFASGFGVGGIVTSALIAGGVAIYDFFNAADKQAQEARKKLEEQFRGLASGGSLDAASKRSTQLFSGDKFVDPNDPLAKLIEGGGVQELRRQRATIQRELDALGKAPGLDAGGAAMERYNKAVAPIAGRLAEVDAKLARIEPEFTRVNGLVSQFADKVGREAVNAAAQFAAEHPFDALGKEIERTTEAAQSYIRRGLEPTEPIVEALIKQQATVTGLLEGQESSTSLAANTLRGMLDTLHGSVDAVGQMRADMETLAHLKIPGLTEPVPRGLSRPDAAPLPGLGDNVSRAASLGSLAQAAKATGASNASALEAAANAQRERSIAIIRRLIEVSDENTTSTDAGRAALAGLVAELNELGVSTDTTTGRFDTMRSALQGVLDIGGLFKNMNRDVLSLGSNVLHAVDALQDLQSARAAASAAGTAVSTAATIAGTLGVVGGVVGAIGALSTIIGGESEAHRRTQELMNANNERLRELRTALDGTTRGAQRNVRAQEAIGAVTEGLPNVLAQGPFAPIMEFVTKQLGAFGFTLEQIADLAKAYGIEIYDADGKLVLESFKQLDDALKLAGQAMTKFSSSFEDQSALQNLYDRVFGKTDDADKFNSTLKLLTQFAPELAAGLEGIDVTTQEGRDKIEAALQALVTQLMAGAITLEQFGDLEGAKQLADIILLLQDSLDGMRDATDGVTKSLLNVPSWYKVNLARFNAVDPFVPPSTGVGPPSGGGSPAGGRPSSTSSGRTLVPNGSGDAVTGVVRPQLLTFAGDIYVDAHERDADELFAAILKVAKRKAAITFGDSTQWSRVQEA